jgi:serine protease DegS
MKTGFRWHWALLSFAAGAGTVLVTLWALRQAPSSGSLPSPSTRIPTPSNPPSYADAVALAEPAVVNIFARGVRADTQRPAFRDFTLPFPQRGSAASLGSGVILSRDGLVLTNRHIIEGADAIRVVLADGTVLDATVLGSDPETDIAVLETRASNLPVISIGRVEELRIGDVVLAIGNPFGIGQSVTMGIVGATGRNQLGISNIENFIQTDAAINPGNSGGALINARGELVGINTAIFSKSGGSEGIGFAIPVDLATQVMQQILTKGRVVRGWIGILGRDVSPQLAESFGLRTHSGVLVSSTAEKSPAEHAGLRPGDVVTRVDGKAVTTTHELFQAVAAAGPGSTIELEIWRGSERIRTRTTSIEPSTSKATKNGARRPRFSTSD